MNLIWATRNRFVGSEYLTSLATDIFPCTDGVNKSKTLNLYGIMC